MSLLNGKKVIIIGDRDGVPGPAIEECVKTAGAEVVYSHRMLCLNWLLAMDLGKSEES